MLSKRKTLPPIPTMATMSIFQLRLLGKQKQTKVIQVQYSAITTVIINPMTELKINLSKGSCLHKVSYSPSYSNDNTYVTTFSVSKSKSRIYIYSPFLLVDVIISYL